MLLGTRLSSRFTRSFAEIRSIFNRKLPDIEVKSMVDTGELSDRAVSERAGIGWSGKNCSIITPEFGSYVYLGEMITNVPFPPDQPIEDQCGAVQSVLIFVLQVL